MRGPAGRGAAGGTTGPLALAGFFLLGRSSPAMRWRPCGHSAQCSRWCWWAAASRFDVALCQRRRTSVPWWCMASTTKPMPPGQRDGLGAPQLLPVTVVPGGGHFSTANWPCSKAWWCAIWVLRAELLPGVCLTYPQAAASVFLRGCRIPVLSCVVLEMMPFFPLCAR